MLKSIHNRQTSSPKLLKQEIDQERALGPPCPAQRWHLEGLKNEKLLEGSFPAVVQKQLSSDREVLAEAVTGLGSRR